MENNKNLISVLVSTYNNENTIEKSIKSIMNQTYNNIEILINDDGSKDRTYEICKKIADKNSIIRLFKNKQNLGLTKSLNILISNSSGDFIARTDADDFNEPTRLEKQLHFLKYKNLDACTTRAYKLNTKNKIPGISFYIPRKLLIKFKNPFIHGTLLIKREVLKKLNNYDENFYYAQDYKLMKDLIDKNFKISILNSQLYFLNMDNNISTLFKDKQNYYADCVRKNKIPS